MNEIDQNSENTSNGSKDEVGPAAPQPRKKLYKSGRNVVIIGICGGIAEYLVISPVFVRIIFILLTLFGGWGIALYAVLAFMMPSNPTADKDVFERIDLKRSFGFALLLTGAYFFFGFNYLEIFNLFSFTETMIFPIILAAVGIWILSKGETNFSFTQVIKKRDFHRSKEQKKLLGVCGGLSEYLNTEANALRAFWLILSFATLGIGIIIYFLLVLFTNPKQETIINEE